MEQGEFHYGPSFIKLSLTGLAASMAVNALVTGLIVFKILKVFWGNKAVWGERALDGSTNDTNLQHIIFVIIESGMVLFLIQLVRFVLFVLEEVLSTQSSAYATTLYAMDVIIGVHEMLNVIIRSVHSYLCFTDICLARALHQQ